ncbi:glycoside hydrolase family 3 domain protein [Paenibacillus curdlanolyticus YK9]|uniref:beta-N-acetylhexosaminidase n=1 Tax=Paenibacillus curdlanolyticus YK9 TaxID=717606 RepID=E0IF11_9BACL|nr:glycoside hydrolase family 3 protein [Paenibacillus curdlanolyticus]EFM08787.1 glycoside hydrolase family 3 domain protein [Paenibacillus curdlanolyticus YK9]
MVSAQTTELSLEQKAARMCVVGIAGYEPGVSFGERLRRLPFGGIGMFPHNIESESQARQFIKGVAAAAEHLALPKPYYISIDEEGGSLSNFRRFYPYLPGNRAVGLSGDSEAAYLQGKLIGSQLIELGVPMNWAPVLDVNTNIANPVVGIRAYGESPEQVASFGAAFIRGLHEVGVAATAKHFPGHGQVEGDSHYVLPSCDLTLEELLAGPIVPFVRAINAGTDAIMMAHILFPRIPESNGLPSSLSPFFVTELLRNRLCYEGVICTDDVEMGAIMDNFEPRRIGELAVMAGNDMILMCHTREFQDEVVAGIVAAVERGDIPMAQIDASVARIDRMHETMEVYRREARPVPREQWAARALELARSTIRVAADPRGLLPLDRTRTYALIQTKQEAFTKADISGENEIGLTERLSARGLSVMRILVPINPSASEIAEALAQAAACDAVLLCTVNAHLHEGQIELAQAAAAVKPLVTLVMRNPYDEPLLPVEATRVLACSTADSTLEALSELLVEING